MNEKPGARAVALIAGAVVIAALAGALVAGAFSDRGGGEQVVVTAAAPAGPAGAGEDDPLTGPAVDHDDLPLRPAEADRVAKAAVAIAGGGIVTEIGRSDDPGEAYEVEVVTDGGEVDIALDQRLNRVRNNPYDD